MTDQTAPISKKALWTGWIMTVLPVLLFVMSGVMKLTKSADVVKGFTQLGYDGSLIVPIGIAELACTIIYLVPRTAVLGAILLTGYLGGATASTLRAGQGWMPTILFGVVLWGGLFFRDPRLRALIPLRR